MSRYLRDVPSVARKNESNYEESEVEEQEQPKPARKPRGSSPYAQVKVRRDLYETLGVVGKMNSLSTAQVIEKILEAHTEQFKEGLKSLRMESMF